jgi:hypothetical protein
MAINLWEAGHAKALGAFKCTLFLVEFLVA